MLALARMASRFELSPQTQQTRPAAVLPQKLNKGVDRIRKVEISSGELSICEGDSWPLGRVGLG